MKQASVVLATFLYHAAMRDEPLAAEADAAGAAGFPKPMRGSVHEI